MRVLILAVFCMADLLGGCGPTAPITSENPAALTVIQAAVGHHTFGTATVEFCSNAQGLPIVLMKESMERQLQRWPNSFLLGGGLVVSCSVTATRERYEEPETGATDYTLRIQFADPQGSMLAVISIGTAVTQSGAGGVYDFSDLDRAADEVAKFAVENFR